MSNTEHSAEKDVTCGCRWNREAGGSLEFRECSQHYVARVLPPARTDA